MPNRRVLWEIQRQQVRIDHQDDKADLVAFLGDGWEPYAVTWDGDSFDYHLRRWFFEDAHADGRVCEHGGVTVGPYRCVQCAQRDGREVGQ